MTKDQMEYIKDAISFWEFRGKDWGDIVEFLSRKFNGTLDQSVYRAGRVLQDGKTKEVRP